MDRKMNVDSTMSKDTHEGMDPGMDQPMDSGGQESMSEDMREGMDPRMDEAMDQSHMDESRDADMRESMDHAKGTAMDDTGGMHMNRQRKWGWFRRKSRRA